MLNEESVITLGCCCGHGKAGQIVEWENAYGKWKGHADPPITLIKEESVKAAMNLGYQPYPYYYADGENNGVWQMHLQSGCITKLDCENWHIKNGLPLEKHIGVI
ncbi:hypothetical protein SAMN05216232_0199 [Virgibacillus subterraneus]|uniref:Uncharacterized protein n=1 Tax=Virgibacillus subterraneus TaxID=621109 RepID=A0A1H8YYP3_9BACI|nr:hypothetical protein [Virgibacillus subterraneus]SEP57226.1 hypothetical protein SAMN05216232_0199 [Virgibacillus subterraneus]